MNVYADTSFLVALYLLQPNSPSVSAFMRQHGQPLPFTPWHRLEVRNALRLAVFNKAITSQQVKIQLKQLEEDLREQMLLTHTPVDWISVLRRAENLGARHNESIGCRSGDLFHIAAAMEMDTELFLTFNYRQGKLAKETGLTVKG